MRTDYAHVLFDVARPSISSHAAAFSPLLRRRRCYAMLRHLLLSPLIAAITLCFDIFMIFSLRLLMLTLPAIFAMCCQLAFR